MICEVKKLKGSDNIRKQAKPKGIRVHQTSNIEDAHIHQISITEDAQRDAVTE